MTKENFNRIMAGLEEVRRHAAGEDVPGMVIHRPTERSMVEWVADAIQAHQTRHGPDYEGLARAAIEAMRDNLTDGMGEIIAKHGRCCGGIAHTIWVETCDEALK